MRSQRYLHPHQISVLSLTYTAPLFPCTFLAGVKERWNLILGLNLLTGIDSAGGGSLSEEGEGESVCGLEKRSIGLVGCF